MRIKSIRIKNFRAFADETISLDHYTCLVGANGAGKSSLLSALNIFFREPSNATDVISLSAEDFHQKNVAERVEITLVFNSLSDAAKAELKDYVRNEELIVSAVATFDEIKARATVKQVGSRMGIPAFARFFEAYKANAGAPAIQQIFDELKVAYPGIPDPEGRSKDAKRDALQQFESDPANAHQLSAIESEDQFYGIAGNFKLKPYIQWVYVPAVKDASDEQAESKDGALGKLLARTVRARVNFKDQLANIEAQADEQYQQLLAVHQGALDEVALSLSDRLGEWSHPDVDLKLNWNSSPISIKEPSAKVTAGEQGFEGDLARFGHGFQRSYLLALLQELATIEGNDAPTLMLGVEEPELYQHPPQARYLSQVLQTLAKNNAQVIITTHSPYFVGGSNFEHVRLVRKAHGTPLAKVYATTHAKFAERYADAGEDRPLAPRAIAAQINEVLRANLNEMFFATKIVLVEGPEDIAYLMSWITLKRRLGQFRSQGIHVVAVEGKSNLARPLIVAQELGIPVYVVFDGDREQSTHGGHIADNKRLLRILGVPAAPLFPDDVHWGQHFVQWPDDMSRLVKLELEASLGAVAFTALMERARVACGLAPSLDKNSLFIQHQLELAHDAGATCATLDRLCDELLGPNHVAEG